MTDTNFNTWVHRAKVAESDLADVAREREEAEDAIKQWANLMSDDELPVGVRRERVTDIDILDVHYQNMAKALLGLQTVIPQIGECISLTIDTKKLAQVIAPDGVMNPLLAHLTMGVQTRDEITVDVSQLVDEVALGEKKQEAIEWATEFADDEWVVLLHIDATERHGLPVHICVQNMVSGQVWSKLMNPGVSVQTDYVLQHGIDLRS